MAGVMDRAMGLWGGKTKTKEELERSRRKLEYDLGEVEIKLSQRHPPKEVDKLEANKRKLQYEIQEIDEDLKNLALKEEAENKAHQREIDQINRQHEEDRHKSNERRQRNKRKRKEMLKKYDMASSIEDSTTEVLAPCCNCVIL